METEDNADGGPEGPTPVAKIIGETADAMGVGVHSLDARGWERRILRGLSVLRKHRSFHGENSCFAEAVGVAPRFGA